MKKVILAVMLMALALFLILPNLSWAQQDLYKAKCAGCHGADGKGSAAGKKMGAPDFSSDKVQNASDAELADFIENGGPQKKASHAFAGKGVSQADATKLADSLAGKSVGSLLLRSAVFDEVGEFDIGGVLH